ncbi:MAG: hypothetical protein NTV73_07375 [Hyphomicrobiales bacterium]|nr:hypothetical protein [Hyphomicrobiales bacterium]
MFAEEKDEGRFYTRSQIEQLVSSLKCVQPDNPPVPFDRPIFDIDRSAAETVREFDLLSNGKFAAMVAAKKHIKRLGRALESLNQEAIDTLGNYWGDRSPSPLDTIKLAIDFHEKRQKNLDFLAKGEGKSNVGQWAFSRFLIIASRIWFAATGSNPKPGKYQNLPSNDYSRFMMVAAEPVAKKLGLQPLSADAMYTRLQQSLEVQKEPLLNR